MEKDVLWFVGQFGILLEAVGAIWIVVAAYLGMRAQEESEVNHAGVELTEIRNAEMPAGPTHDAFTVVAAEFRALARKKFRNELIGFGMLATGLLLQFAGNW